MKNKNIDTKFCNKCKTEKSVEDFYKRGKYYCAHCKDCMKKNNKKWHIENKERARERRKKWRENNEDYMSKYMKQWRKDNKEHIKEYKRNDYHKNKTDEFYKLKIQTRHLIFKAYERKGYKKGSRTEEILGCSYEEFIKHLLRTYKNNYGADWNDEEQVHIDHIIPLSTAQTEEEIIKLNHYTDLQLLKAKDNLEKSNKLDWKVKEENI